MSDAGKNATDGARRSFRADDGALWTVTEREVGHWRDGRPRRSLIFEGEGVLRRVYDYPADWRRLTDAELERLSWGR